MNGTKNTQCVFTRDNMIIIFTELTPDLSRILLKKITTLSKQFKMDAYFLNKKHNGCLITQFPNEIYQIVRIFCIRKIYFSKLPTNEYLFNKLHSKVY